MPKYHIGRYAYCVSRYRDIKQYYFMKSLRPPDMHSDIDDRTKNCDHLLHQSLNKIFHERCLGSIKKMKRFLCGLEHSDKKSIINPIFEDEEPILSENFSKEKLVKLSLLWIAVLGGYQMSAELLVRSGADVNEPFGHRDPQVIDEKWTVLYVLLQMDPSPENERLISMIIDHGVNLQARDYLGRTVLHYAVWKRRIQVIKKLLEKGADVNATGNKGLTPLLIAVCTLEANEMLPMLMKHGADVLVKPSRTGENALHRLAYAYQNGRFKHTDPIEIARVLIEKGVSLDDRAGEELCQPIHLAAGSVNNKLVDFFLDHGANVNALTDNTVTPLYFAAQSGGHATIETLLKRGANIHLRTTSKGRTALHAACVYAALPEYSQSRGRDYESAIGLLLSFGADVLAEDSDGKTPFYIILSGENVKPPGTWPLIKALALRKSRQPSIELKDERIIERNPELQNYYQDCMNEIDRIKSTRFIHTCTFFELLTKSHCKIASLMRNPKFETKFQKYDLDEFSKYAEYLLRAFKLAQKHYLAMLEQKSLINEAVYNILPDLVVDKVVHYVLIDARV